MHTQLSLPDLPGANKSQPTCLAGSKITTSVAVGQAAMNTTTTTTSTSLSTGSLPHAVRSELDKKTKTIDSIMKSRSSTRKDQSFLPADISDTQSETSYRINKKTLPREPTNEIPVTMNTLKRIANKNSLNKSILQRPSSSLDFTENELIKQTMLNSILNTSNKSLNRLNLNKSLTHLSPYSSLSDIANLINQSSAVTLGRLSPAVLASSHASKLGKYDFQFNLKKKK